MNWGSIIIPSVLIIVGITVTVLDTLFRKRKRERCSLLVDAECVDVEKTYYEQNTVYAPIWKYTVNGQEYIIREISYTSRKIDIGEKKDIYINPDNPQEIFRESKRAAVGAAVVGLGIAFISVIVLIVILVTV